MPGRRVPPPLLALLIWTSMLTCPQMAAAAAPAPGEGKLDWIRLASGEWLAGRLKYMRNEDIEFDSDKLDVLHLKWEDVIELRCSRVLVYAFTEQRLATGPATMRDSVIRVQEEGQVREFRSEELLSIIEGKGSELDLWSGNFSLGFVARTGNTDQLDYNSLGFVRRDGAISRVDLRYAGNFGELEGARSINNQLGSTRIDLFLSRNLFVTPFALELYSDEFQNVALRTSASAGAGVYVIKKKGLEWFLQVGGGYLSTRYRSVIPGEDIEDTGASIIPLISLEWEPVKDLKLNVDYNSNISIPDVEKLFHHFVALLTVGNLKIVDLNTSITWDHVTQPKSSDDGTLPSKDDLRTAFGIGIEF